MERPKGKTRKPKLLYVLGCEGKNQETQYFERVKEIINSIPERTKDIDFLYAEPYGGDPKCVVQRTIAKSIGKTNKASVFDFDQKTTKYEEAIDLAVENQIDLGNSNYCFDLWLILHKEDYCGKVNHQDDYAPEVRRLYGLSNNANIKKLDNVTHIVGQIEMADLKTAIVRADAIEQQNKLTTGNTTAKGYVYYDNPDTQVHQIVRKILTQVGLTT